MNVHSICKAAGPILITRPIEQGREFAALVRSRLSEGRVLVPDTGVDDVFSFLPVLEIEPIFFNLPDSGLFSGLIFSSANGVRVFADRCKEEGEKGFNDLPVFTVGAFTAHTARAAGFADIRHVAEDARGLCAFFFEHRENFNSTSRLLSVRGADVHADFEDILCPDLCDVSSLVAYTASAVSFHSHDVLELLSGQPIACVTFFSKRTALIFIENMRTFPALLNLKKVDALCISRGVLEAVRPSWEGHVYCASSPNQGGMVDLVVQYIREKNMYEAERIK